MPLAGRQLSYKWALALCRFVGWRGSNLVESVAVMCAESGRYIEAYNENRDGDGNVTSTDRGLYQINDRFHPDLPDEQAYQAVPNAFYAFTLSQAGKHWQPWAAYNGGFHLPFVPIIAGHLANAKAGGWNRSLDERVEIIRSGGPWPGATL